MANEEKYLLIDERVVPDIFKKVLEAKRQIATGKAKNASESSSPTSPAAHSINIRTMSWSTTPASPTTSSPCT